MYVCLYACAYACVCVRVHACVYALLPQRRRSGVHAAVLEPALLKQARGCAAAAAAVPSLLRGQGRCEHRARAGHNV